MFCIALIGQPEDNEITRYFCRAADDSVCIVESESAVRFCGCRGVTVIKKFSEADLSDCRGTVIICSENIGQLKKLLRLKNPVITCGMGSKDTITCTGRTRDAAAIALQRPIAGRETPYETPVAADEGEDIYSIMAFEAARLLMTESPSLSPQEE